MRKLIVNADDFGLTTGVNRAIIESFQSGSISSTTLLVSALETGNAVELSRLNPELGVGLHFNLTLGQPISAPDQVRSLVKADGTFYSRSEAYRNMLLRRCRVADIEREFLAQVTKYQEMGLSMTHIDSHQHIHLFPQVFDIIAQFCSDKKIPLRLPWVWTKGQGRQDWRRRVRSRFLSLLVNRHFRKWGANLLVNKGFGSVFDLTDDPFDIKAESYSKLLEDNDSVSPFELMVHPAYVDDNLRSLTRIAAFSDVERDLLTQFSLGEAASHMGWELVSYKGLID